MNIPTNKKSPHFPTSLKPGIFFRSSLYPLLLLGLCGFSNAPKQNTCALVVDAGSSGTRLEVFPLPITPTSPPLSNRKVTSIGVGISWPYETTGPLSPSDAGTVSELVGCLATMGIEKPTTTKVESAQRVCEQRAQQLSLKFKRRENPAFERCTHIHLFIYGTAGMRLIERSGDYSTYWDSLIKDFSAALHLLGKQITSSEAGTISGYEEGLFEFLALEASKQTSSVKPFRLHGFMGVGGASAQIMWENSSPPATVDHHTISVDHSPFSTRTIAGYSFLGWGINEAFDSLDKQVPSPCSAGTGGGDFNTCKNNLRSQLLPSKAINLKDCPKGMLLDPLNSSGSDNKSPQCVSLQSFQEIQKHLSDTTPFFATGGALKYMGWPLGNSPLKTCCTSKWSNPEQVPPACSYRPEQSCFRGAWAEAIVEVLGLKAGWTNKGDANWQLGAVLCQLSNEGQGCIVSQSNSPLRCRWTPDWTCPKRVRLPQSHTK